MQEMLDTQETGDTWIGKTPWRRKWQPAPVSLPGKSHGQWSLAGYSPWGHKVSDKTERLNKLKVVGGLSGAAPTTRSERG